MIIGQFNLRHLCYGASLSGLLYLIAGKYILFYLIWVCACVRVNQGDFNCTLDVLMQHDHCSTMIKKPTWM